MSEPGDERPGLTWSGLELAAKYTSKAAGSGFLTRTEERRRQGGPAERTNKVFTKPYQVGEPLHTATYINERGDIYHVKFDSSRPCAFSTHETRFYKPSCHKFGY